MIIELLPQERPCRARFDTPIYMTTGFSSEFGGLALLIVQLTMYKIQAERVSSSEGADYFQSATFYGGKFWIIDDQSHVTFLMPHEY